jgi:hypothetical protein
MLRQRLNDAMKEAMRAKDARTLSTCRLILAALKDRDIANRTADAREGIPDEDILKLLQSMIKQRRDSIEAYVKGNRPELAQQEQEEIAVIETFLPQQMSEAEIDAAVDAVIAEIKADSLKQMGAVMAVLRDRFAGSLDMGKAGARVKAKLS